MSSVVAASQIKLNELLEAIRQEFSQVSQEANSYRLQNQKDYDYKINQQLAEMQQIRNTVYELELTHRKMKDAYEEEINRLKIELEQNGRQLASFTAHHQQQQVQQAQQAVQQPVVPAVTTSSTFGGTLLPPSSMAGQQPPMQLQSGGTEAVATPREPPAKLAPVTGEAQPVVRAPSPHPTASPATPAAAPAVAPVVAPTAPMAPAAPLNGNSPATQHVSPAPAAEVKTPAQEGEQLQQEHYLVPYNVRASHTKPIPPFLLDLDSQTVPAHLKKQTNDYYILYNPALPRELDVELHKSLDHTSVVCCVRFSNDGEYLATGCNKTTQVFRVSDGALIARLSDDAASQVAAPAGSPANADEPNNDVNSFVTAKSASSDLYIRSVCFSPDGKFLATGAEDRLIRIWDIAKKQIVMVLQGHEQDIYSLDYFPSGDKLVSGSGDRTVRIWDLRTGQCSLTLSIEDGVTTVAVSPGDGKFIAAGSLDRAVRVWDSETGFLVERLDSENELGTGHKDSVYSVVFTRDGNGVVSGSLDRSVKLWNLRGDKNNSSSGKPTPGTCEVTYTGHKDFVLSVATTQNDQYILSGSKDRGVLFWDTQSGNPLLMLQGHRNSVISVAVANGFPLGPQYGVFATGSGDCKARIWKYTKTDAGIDSGSKIKEVRD